MCSKKTLILIDGHALAFRQYYALERTNMQTSDGTPTWAVYGFFKAVFDLLKNKKLQPDAICVAFDVSHHTFRVDEYAEYKSNREAMPDNMQIQMGLIYEGLKAFDIPIYTKEGFEADDVIGTIAKQACELGHKVYILTGDQDSFQLIDKDGCTTVIIPSKGLLTHYDWEKVHEKLGVYPNQIVDYKSLRGDTSDNIPGVKGIGEKTAVKLIEEYGSLENLIKNCESIKPDGIRQRFCDNIEMAKLSYKLATIVKDVDINFDFEGTKVAIPDISKVTEFLRKLQLYSFLKNIDELIKTFDKNNSKTESQKTEDAVEIPVSENGQLGLFAEAVKKEVNKTDFEYEYHCIDDLKLLEGLKSLLMQKKLISYQFVGDINNFKMVIGYCKSIQTINDFENMKDDCVTYVINVDIPSALNILKPVFENENIKKITYDVKYSYKILKKFSTDLKGVIFDTLLASYVKDASQNHNLDIQALEHLDFVLDSALGQKISDNLLTVMPVVIFKLTKYWLESTNQKEQNLIINTEIPLAIILGKMELTGVAVDTGYLQTLSEDMSKSLKVLENKIFAIAGESFNINSPKQVADIIYDKLQLKTVKRGKKSTGAEVLEELAKEHEIARLILDYRLYSKLKSTYTDALPELLDKADNRIHTTYNQATTVTGRLSSSNPNLQNIPIRTPEGSKIRKAFVAQDKENGIILSADYSQIELRLLAHISKDENLISAFNSGVDVHTLTASKVFDVKVEDVTKEMRYRAKAVNFGIIYGQSKYGLAKVLEISAAEAEKFINKYFQTYPKIRIYMDEIVNYAIENGYVETLFGRKRYLTNELNNPNAMIREFAKRAAINHPMQGTAADLIKIAMISLDKKLTENNFKSKLIMQVHDELILETNKNELNDIKNFVTESMELGQPFDVPLVVDVEAGVSW